MHVGSPAQLLLMNIGHQSFSEINLTASVMKILSIDVGIKNLAACVISIDSDSNLSRATVSWWNLIDLTEKAVLCGENCEKPLRPCGKNATFTATCGLTTFYYCGLHKKLHAPKQEAYIADLAANNLSTPAQKKKTIGLATLKPVKTRTCKQLPVTDLKISLWRQLDALPRFLQVQHVIVENQPAIKNPTMKSIAETLFAFFLCRGIIDKPRNNSQIEKVHYVSASNKMKLAPEFHKELAASKNKYKTTKDLSVRTCMQLMDKDSTGEKFLQDHKKKDDLCDSLLQGLYFLKKLDPDVNVSTVVYKPE